MPTNHKYSIFPPSYESGFSREAYQWQQCRPENGISYTPVWHPGHIQTPHHCLEGCAISVNLQEQSPIDAAMGDYFSSPEVQMKRSSLKRSSNDDNFYSTSAGQLLPLSSNHFVFHTSSKVQMLSSLGSAPDHCPSPLSTNWVNDKYRRFYMTLLWYSIQHWR